MLKQFEERYADTPLGRLQRVKPLSAFHFPQLDITLACRGSCRTASGLGFVSMVVFDSYTYTKTFNIIVPVMFTSADMVYNLGHVAWPMCRAMCFPDYDDMGYPVRDGSDEDKDIMFECICRNMYAKQKGNSLIRDKFRLLSDVIGNSNVSCYYGHQYRQMPFVRKYTCNILATANLMPYEKGIKRIIFTDGYMYHFETIFANSHTKYEYNSCMKPDNFL